MYPELHSLQNRLGAFSLLTPSSGMERKKVTGLPEELGGSTAHNHPSAGMAYPGKNLGYLRGAWVTHHLETL